MATHSDWKKKYFEALRELETLEKSGQQQEQLLRKGIARLAITAKGHNQRLDTLLSGIQKHCKKKQDEALAKDLDKLTELLNTLETSTPADSYAWLDFAADLTQRLHLPETLQAQHQQLQSRLADLDADQALGQIVALIRQLLELDEQKQAVETTAPAKPEASPADHEDPSRILLDTLVERVTATFGSNAALQQIQAEIAAASTLDWRAFVPRIVEQIRTLVHDINQDKAKLESLVLVGHAINKVTLRVAVRA